MGMLYNAGPNSWLTFIFLTIGLGGAAALAAGRALAATWRPQWQCALYAAPIAAAIAFLHYALFQEAVIPLSSIAAALARLPGEAGAALAGIAFHLRGFGVLFVIHALFLTLGYRLARRRQMMRQYGFLRWPAATSDAKTATPPENARNARQTGVTSAPE